MFDITQFGGVLISVQTIVSLIFYMVLGAYAVFSGIFYYHWKAYGTDLKVTTYTLIVYFATTIPLLIGLAILTLLI